MAPCAHAQDVRTEAAEAAAPPQRNAFMSAVGQPLADLNINQSEIPDSLRKAADDPYARDAETCAAMATEIAALDAALGPDLDIDTPKATKRKMASRAAARAVRRLAVSWIPYRGIVRTVTGAEAHARKAQEAALAGAVRRAYLKGLGERDGCGPGAAPRRVALDHPPEAVAPPAVDAVATVGPDVPSLEASPEPGEAAPLDATLIPASSVSPAPGPTRVSALTTP